MNSSSQSSICQYLGLKHDSATAIAYPSKSNHCFHCQVPSIPVLEHQRAYCLVEAHTNCPIYIQPETKPFPKNIMDVDIERRPQRRPVWQFIALGIGVLLVGLVLWLGYKSLSARQVPVTQNPILPATSTRIPANKVTPTAIGTPPLLTNTPVPVTPTPETSSTPTEFPPQAHALEVPILVGKQPFLMHRILEGEQILFLTQQHQTTLKVLEWINQAPPTPLLVGKVIVIAPGLMDIDQTLPPFEAYQVTDEKTNLQGLAGKLGVDLEKLKYYNHCSDICQLVKGDWLLVPPQTNSPIPYTPTPGPSPTPGKPHALEVPFTVGNQTLLMHRILDGEQLVFLTEQHQTTIEVLQEINYKQAVPLWAGQVIVIAPGLIVNIDPELPPFEPYEVTDKEISIEDLNLKLGADLAMLKYYNGCSDGCQFVKGDWLLIPHSK